MSLMTIMMKLPSLMMASISVESITHFGNVD